jgi:hypothetical protein
MTTDQKKAFGFTGTSILWTEVLKFIQEAQQNFTIQAVSHASKGEDRVHLCGQADAANYILSALIELRKQARELNGLTPDEDLA